MGTHRTRLARAAAETLESRVLLSAVSLDFGTLSVAGDGASANKIALSVKKGNLLVSMNRHVQSFPLASVESIHITGGSGNDVITVANGITLPTQIDGLGGNDHITGSTQPGIITTGDGRSVVSPGSGDNYIDLSVGNNVLNLPATSAKTKSLADTVIVNSSTVIHRRNRFTQVFASGSGPQYPLMPWQQRATPTLTGSAIATGGNIITLSQLSDSVTLSGGKNPGGSITFTLTAPDLSIADSETVAVNGDGTYSTANTITANLAGTWTWSAVYSGDNHNNAVADVDPSQSSVITLATPSLSSSPYTTDGTTAGTAALHDAVTISGGISPTGTLTLTLRGPDGSTVDNEVIPITGDGVYQSSLLALSDAPGNYTWIASYSGDSLNSPVEEEGDPTSTQPATGSATPVLTPGSGFASPTTVPTKIPFVT